MSGQLTPTGKKNFKNYSRKGWNGNEEEATSTIHIPMKMQITHHRQRNGQPGTLGGHAIYYFSACDQWISWGSMQYVRYQKTTYKKLQIIHMLL